MSGPSPYSALYEIFGHGWPTKDESQQRHIKIIKKSTKKRSKIHDEREDKYDNNKKPSKIDNACQTQPLRDYSYNKVVGPSKKKNYKKKHEEEKNLKIECNDNATFSGNNRVHKKRALSSIGMHLKNSHVSALYKTVSDIEKIFRQERNLHLHSKKCLCNSCGTLGVITESMKHPVDFGDDSTESDDDELDDDGDDDDDEYYNVPPRYNSSKRSWKIEYKDNESINYGVPGTEGYLRLILELEKMIKRVRSLERLAIKNNIPIKRNKVDMAYDIQTHHINSISKKLNRSSTSSSEIDKKQCGLFSIPNVIKRRFSKKERLGTKKETKKEMTASKKLRSKNYQHITNNSPINNAKKNMYIDIDKKYQSNCLDEKIQNFDLALLNEDEICELMFHLKNKASNNAKRINQRTMISSNIERNESDLLYRKSETSKPKSNQIQKPDHIPFKMKSSPIGLRTISDKTNLKSLRNDATFIRKSQNYLDNIVETNRNTKKIYNDFLKINNVTPVEQHNETNKKQRRQKVLHIDRNVSEESANSYNLNIVNKSQNDTVHKLNIDITRHEQKSEKCNLEASKDTLFYKPSKSTNFSKKDWVNEIINKSIGVIEEKYNHEMKKADNAMKGKIGKTVTYSKQNEYHYFRDSIMNIKSDPKTYYCPIEIGESSGLCKQIRQVEQFESSDSDISREYETYITTDNTSEADRTISEKILPLIKNSSHSQIGIGVSKNKYLMSDFSSKQQNTLINEDQNKKEIITEEIPINNYNQFKCKPETHPLRSELRAQNESTYEPVNKHNEKVAEFISNNIFDKVQKKENINARNLFKKENRETKSVQKDENKTIIEKENMHKEDSEETKTNEKFMVKNKRSYRKINEEVRASKTCVKIVKNKIFKKKENKGIQVTEINEEKDNKNIFKNENEETQNVENSKVVTNQNNNNKNNEELKKTQKLVVERKIVNTKDNEEVKVSKMCEVNKSLAKKKSSSNKKENKGTQAIEINDNKRNKNSLNNNSGEINTKQKDEHFNIKENGNLNLNKKSSEEIRKIEKCKLFIDSMRSSRRNKYDKLKCPETCEVIKNINTKLKENKGTQVTEINEKNTNHFSLKGNKETQTIQKDELRKIIENEDFIGEYSKDVINIQKSKFIVENKNYYKKSNERVKSLAECDVKENIVNSKKKDNGTQVTEMNEEKPNKNSSNDNREIKATQKKEIYEKKENIIEEIHECPLSFIFNNFPSFKRKENTSQAKKSILKTYRRVDESPFKLDKRNSIVINKFKKHVNINIVKKVSSSIIHDIFNRKTGHSVTLTNVFKRQKHAVNHKNNALKHSRIPVPISLQSKNVTIPNIPKKISKILSRIPLYKNKTHEETDSRNILNLKPSQKKLANQTYKNVFLHYNAVQNTSPTLKYTKKKDTIIIGNTIYENRSLPKSASTQKKRSSKIPILQMTHNKKQQNGEPTSFSLGNRKLVINGKKTTIYPTFIDTNNDLLTTFSQSLQLYPAFITVPAPPNISKQEDDNKLLPVDSDVLNSFTLQIEQNEPEIGTESIDDTKLLPLDSNILNSYNSQIEKVEHKISDDSMDGTNVLFVDSAIINSYSSQTEQIEHTKITNFANKAKLLPVDSDILSSYNSQIEKLEREIISDSSDEAKVLSVDSDILNSYNSQIEKVERKRVTESINDDKNSHYPITEEKKFYITPPYAIQSYESSCTFSEGSSGAMFIYKSKCQLGTDSEFDTHISESVYTSTNDLNSTKEKRKWKWLKVFGSKFKSFLSFHTPKSSTVDSLLIDGNTSCNETNEISKEQNSKKKVNGKNNVESFRTKWINKPRVSSLSFTLTLKKKNTNSSILLN